MSRAKTTSTNWPCVREVLRKERRVDSLEADHSGQFRKSDTRDQERRIIRVPPCRRACKIGVLFGDIAIPAVPKDSPIGVV